VGGKNTGIGARTRTNETRQLRRKYEILKNVKKDMLKKKVGKRFVVATTTTKNSLQYVQLGILLRGKNCVPTSS
jgi:hypothetical protein